MGNVIDILKLKEAAFDNMIRDKRAKTKRRIIDFIATLLAILMLAVVVTIGVKSTLWLLDMFMTFGT